MIVNRDSLIRLAPIKDMLPYKLRQHGVSRGLSEAGYDICIKQEVCFLHAAREKRAVEVDGIRVRGRFALASAIEEFDMPHNLVGIVHDKSTWARRGLSVFNTVIEPGWKGFLTLELVYHGEDELLIPAGAGIAQVVFHHTTNEAAYEGRYQNQGNVPTPAISSE